MRGSAYLGAVAGDVDSDGTVSGNTFTSENLGALDGISYAGKAEPVDFDSLCSTEGVPELFSQLELTFVADGITVAVVPFQYGEGIESLPEIPAKRVLRRLAGSGLYPSECQSNLGSGIYSLYLRPFGRWGTAGDPCGR